MEIAIIGVGKMGECFYSFFATLNGKPLHIIIESFDDDDGVIVFANNVKLLLGNLNFSSND